MADLGTDGVAEILGLKKATIARKCRDGQFPHATQDKKGSPWHIPMEDVEEYRRGTKHEKK